MSVAINTSLLSEFSQFVTSEMGLYFPPSKWRDLERGITATARKFEFSNVKDCIYWLMSAPLSQTQIETLASFLTVGETYFFRDPKIFEALEQKILPSLIQQRYQSQKNLRIWSAGCASGEEPYSIAMLIRKLMPDIKDWNINLLATDINREFLKNVKKGIYSEWSFRGQLSQFKSTYFKKVTANNYEIISSIKSMVKTNYINLAVDDYPSLMNETNAMDIIFCRNVMMYFSPELIQKIIRKFFACLVEGGWLIVSPSEAHSEYFSDFKLVRMNEISFYQKPQAKELFIDETETQELCAPVALSAVKTVEDSVEVSEVLVFDYQHLAEEYANQGNLRAALSCSEEAIAKDKMNPSLYYLHAMITSELGDITTAVSSLKRVLYLDQNFILAYIALGNIWRQRGKVREANKHFDYALSLLQQLSPDQNLPQSGNMKAGRMIEIVNAVKELR